LYLYDFFYHLGKSSRHDQFHRKLLGLIEEFLGVEIKARSKREFAWKHKIVLTSKLQKDGMNCGPLMCFVAWMTAKLGGAPTEAQLNELTYNKEELSNMRLWMAYSALTDRIWLPPVAETTIDAVRITHDGDWGPVDE
jgi:hypothetical protein